jgi:hypothetical protein
MKRIQTSIQVLDYPGNQGFPRQKPVTKSQCIDDVHVNRKVIHLTTIIPTGPQDKILTPKLEYIQTNIFQSN